MGTPTRDRCCKSVEPPGVKLIKKLYRKEISYEAYRTSVLILTFVAYSLYHASRKPTSIVKSVLDSPVETHTHGHGVETPFSWPLNRIFIRRPQVDEQQSSLIAYGNNTDATGFSMVVTSDRGALKGWSPFDGESGTARLGEVDVAFLAFYSMGMYFAGHLGDRVCLRWFLAVGMVGSGIFVSLFGLAYWLGIHQLYYFFAVQMLAGLFQATGWPSVVTVVANWFGKRKRGLIMGIWNAHTSVGNICGSLIAASVLQYGWGWSFVVPGVVIAAGGILIFLFLVVDPVIVGLPSPYQTGVGMNGSEGNRHRVSSDSEQGLLSEDGLPPMNVAHPIDSKSDRRSHLNHDEIRTPLLGDEESVSDLGENVALSSKHSFAVGFLQAWAIPGVVPFAFCLFFAKLVAYTFLYWLPFYIRHTEIQGEYLSDKTSGNLSTLFDVGGVVGGILAGHLSDKLDARAITAALFMYCAIPALYLYHTYGSLSLWLNMALLALAGMFVNGPYALITTAVSADLGTHGSLNGNARALATVTAIIDGTGSVGAALGPLITGYLSAKGWDTVFILLMLSALVSGLLLTRLVLGEVREKIKNFQSRSRGRLIQEDPANA